MHGSTGRILSKVLLGSMGTMDAALVSALSKRAIKNVETLC